MEPLISSSNDRLHASETIRLPLLHVASYHNDLRYNLDLLENLIQKAAGLRADLITPPELAVCGYEFYQVRGKEWIRTDGQNILERFCQIARVNHTSLVLGCPTYDETRADYHNSAVVIDQNGQVFGIQHIILTLHDSLEGWVVSGVEVHPVEWHGQRTGPLICAEVPIGLAAWVPAEHGPSGDWGRCSQETRLCFYACNSTGQEVLLDFNGNSSVAAADGRRILDYSREDPAILTVEVDPEYWWPVQTAFIVEEIV